MTTASAAAAGMVSEGSAEAAVFAVNSVADASDSDPGDGVCDDGSGACTLRAAVEETNVLPGLDTVSVPAGTYQLASPLLPGDDLTVIGADSATTVIEAGIGPSYVAIWLSNGPVVVTLSGVTFRNGGSGDCVSVTGTSDQGPGAIGSTLSVTAAVFDRCGAAGLGVRPLDDRATEPTTTSLVDTTFIGAESASSYGVFVDAVPGSFTAEGLTVTGAGLTGLHLGMPPVRIAEFESEPSTVEIRDSSIRENGTGVDTFYATRFPQRGLFVPVVMLSNTTAESNTGVGARLMGKISVVDSSFSGNGSIGLEAGDGREGISLDVRRSTIANNGGTGVDINVDIDARIGQSTISGNGGDGIVGGGLELFVTYSTIVDNGGTGLLDPGRVPSVSLLSSIVFGNTTADCLTGDFRSYGGNIDGDGSCNLDAASDQPSTDPLLGPLADNGGLTLTHLPAFDSPAIEAVTHDCFFETLCGQPDQRGVPRPQGPAEDSGSVEVEPAAPTSTTTAPRTTAPPTTTTVVPGTTTPPTDLLPETGPDGSSRSLGVAALLVLLIGCVLLATARTRTEE